MAFAGAHAAQQLTPVPSLSPPYGRWQAGALLLSRNGALQQKRVVVGALGAARCSAACPQRLWRWAHG
jgi:hypothetical protein